MRVAVIGGGPAGMMSAIAAAAKGADVTLFEKNEKLGKKLYISGKGRCNITNDCDTQNFIKNVVTNAKFLLGAINKFTTQDTMDFCRDNGLPIKVERGKRVFPQSDKSSDVIKVFAKVLSDNRVKVRLNCEIMCLEYQDSTILLHTISDIIQFDSVILATGGMSYSATGSTGDGYKFARNLGHSIVEPKPALCRIVCGSTNELEGLSLKNVTVSLKDRNGKAIATEFGELLFTNNGVSGPAALTLSSRINRLLGRGCDIAIDLKPALDCETLNARVLRDFSARMNKSFANSLDDLLPEKLRRFVAVRSGIPLDKKVNQITVEERNGLVDLIKNLTFPFVGIDDIEYGIVTSGGVDVRQVNPSTMESKIIPNLYFAGELLDVDAFTGGFNIQIALSTGYVAGINAARSV